MTQVLHDPAARDHSPICNWIITRGRVGCDCTGPDDMGQDLTPEEEAAADEELRALGLVLPAVPAEQRKQLDMLVGMQPTTKKRRLKKSERTKRRKG